MMKAFFHLTPFVLIALAMLPVACSSLPFLHSPNCQNGICVHVKLGEPLRLNEPIQMTLTIESDHDESRLQAGFGLTDPSILEGPRAWTLDVKAGQPVEVSTTVRFTKEGIYGIVGGVVTHSGMDVSDSVDVGMTASGGILNPTPEEAGKGRAVPVSTLPPSASPPR